MFTEKQITIMKNDKKFMAFLNLIIRTKGNPSTKDFEVNGLPFEYFMRMINPNLSSKKLYANAQRYMAEIEGK